ALRRGRAGARGRHVTISPADDHSGTAALWGSLLATDAAVLERQLTHMAEQVCRDDPRTLDQRRADALGALAAGGQYLACACGCAECPAAGEADPRAGAVMVHLVAREDTLDAQPDPHTSGERPSRPVTPDMTLAEALAPDPEPDVPPTPRPPAAHLLGGGTLPASMVAELIRGGAKVTPVRLPADAPPEPTYRPSAQLQRFIRCRDMTCRSPGCDRPAEFADIDHTIPYPLGPTHASNLKCLCRKHHLLKTFWPGWRDEQWPDGTVILPGYPLLPSFEYCRRHTTALRVRRWGRWGWRRQRQLPLLLTDYFVEMALLFERSAVFWSNSWIPLHKIDGALLLRRTVCDG
ncbi:HNH endonuclease signature motif containing protein, partial [Mycobacterium sp. 1245805.9]|uniref:HNH endonuclease signature motif containing protein n=1 Tax=Mycobacterium sp. 1245805.9 TaxID=1856862 RepID=UPI000A5285E3